MESGVRGIQGHRARERITKFDLDDEGLERLVNAVDRWPGDIDMDELHALLERGAAYDDDVLRRATTRWLSG